MGDKAIGHRQWAIGDGQRVKTTVNGE